MEFDDVKIESSTDLQDANVVYVSGEPVFGLSISGRRDWGDPPIATLYWRGALDRPSFLRQLDDFCLALNEAPAMSGVLRCFGSPNEMRFDLNDGQRVLDAKELASMFDIFRADVTTGLGEFTFWATFGEEDSDASGDLNTDGENAAIRLGEALFPLTKVAIVRALTASLPVPPDQMNDVLESVWSSTWRQD